MVSPTEWKMILEGKGSQSNAKKGNKTHIMNKKGNEEGRMEYENGSL